MIFYIFLAMLFCHVVDDYYLQGILANMKQKEWWQENAPQTLYAYDYIVALLMHSISWTFMIMLPIAIYKTFNITIAFAILFVINVAIHAIIDDLKANKKKINLLTDQYIHILQIAVTFIILICFDL